MLKIELSGRLKVVADMVEKCDVLCDVGTDHGLIPVYLINKQVIKRAVASDVNAGPLESARKNIYHWNCQDKIVLRLGDGLKVIDKGECDCVVIAGIGGYLIRDIIDVSYQVAASLKQMVLQPMNRHEVLREYLYENGFDIVDERLARDNEKYYMILSVVHTGFNKAIPDKINLYIGEKLIDNRDPLLPDYLNKQIKTCCKILDRIGSSEGNEAAREKHLWLKSGYEAILNKIS